MKKLYPSAKFAAFVYYPFDHEEIEARLSGTQIDLVVFAGEKRGLDQKGYTPGHYSFPLPQVPDFIRVDVLSRPNSD